MGTRAQSKVARCMISTAFALLLTLLWLQSGADTALAASSSALPGVTWRTVNDTVMGGRSSSRLKQTEKGHLLWSGNLSLANNGGFVSIRSEDSWADWSQYDGIEVVIEGGGRDIQVTAQRKGMRVRAGGYRAPVPTHTEGDTRVVIPFSAFVLKSFGREIRGPALSQGLDSVGQWGLLISDKREGSFSVVLKSMKPARLENVGRLSPEVRPALVAAIERGVPAFNGGDARGCATIYGDVLAALGAQGKLGQSSWALLMARAARKRAAREGPTDAAWTLRRAIDAILKSTGN